MIVNPGKFQAIIINKRTNTILMILWKLWIKYKSFTFCESVRCPNRTTNLILTSNNFQHWQICRKSAQCSDKAKRFLAFEEKKTLIKSHLYSNFNYFPLVWIFFSAKSLSKVESLQKSVLGFLYDNYYSSYESIHDGLS